MAPLLEAIIPLLLGKLMNGKEKKKKGSTMPADSNSSKSTIESLLMNGSGNGIPTGQAMTPSDRMKSSYY